MDCAIGWLGENRPIITVGESRLAYFQCLFDNYGFRHTAAVSGMYRPEETEHIFNDFAGNYAFRGGIAKYSE